ncbi:MAG: hypothetical protein WC744_00105 [Patescibacteria group bacterium]|jgi:hypothetical protein
MKFENLATKAELALLTTSLSFVTYSVLANKDYLCPSAAFMIFTIGFIWALMKKKYSPNKQKPSRRVEDVLAEIDEQKDNCLSRSAKKPKPKETRPCDMI